MLKKLFVLFVVLFATPVFAANWYVRPNGGSYSSEDGSDWTNAYDGFSDIAWGSVSCGDTIWVAGGTYTQNLTIAKNCSSGSQLYIRRARADSTDCTEATGWDAGYASTVHQVNTGIRNNGDYDYVTVSGRTTASGGTHGWYIDYTGSTGGSGVAYGNGADVDYNTIEYVDIQGPGYIEYTTDGRGLDITPGYSVLSGHNTYSHLKVWDWESGIYCGWSEYEIFEYIEVYGLRAVNWASYHPNMFYLHDANYITIRYGNFHGALGEGIFFTNNDTNIDGAYIYGNVFHSFSGSTQKAIQPDNTGTTNDIQVYNNTFDYTYLTFYGDGIAGATNSNTKNNIFSRCQSGCGSIGTTSDNLSTSTDVFVDRSGADYHIVATISGGYPRDAGATLTSTYNTDPDGNTRGADGTWDIGAYEYDSGGDTTDPVVTITDSDPKAVSSSSTTLTGTASDANGIDECKWRSGSAPDESN